MPLQKRLSQSLAVPAFLSVALVSSVACIPPEVDALVEVDAPSPMYRFQIAKHIRGSTLWRAYVEHLSTQRAGSDPVVAIDVTFERTITDDIQTGDYDAGIVYADLSFRELITGTTLLTDHDEFEIPNYVIAREDATRDEVQDEAFEVVEEKAVRSIRYSMDLALIRAMGQAAERHPGFVSALEEVRDSHWSVGLKQEAETALATIGSPSM